MVKESLRTINVKIEIYNFGEIEKPYQIHLLKNLYFSESNGTFIATNWFEGYFKFHFPKYALSKTLLNTKQNDIFKFYITDSELLTSDVSTIKHFSGKVERNVISKVAIDKDQLSHLGILSISTDRYIGDYASNIVEVTSLNSVSSIVTFYKKIKPIIDILLLFTSFAERRRLNWYKCEGSINENYVEFYNTRVTFFQDKRCNFLVSRFVFEDYIKHCLSNISDNDVLYITKLLRSYFSGVDYSVNAKIILWNSILERILKKNFSKKKDSLKESLISQMGVYTSDLPPIKELIDIRNALIHGDDEEFNELFELSIKWQVLIERILLHELKWNDLSKTDVNVNGLKPYGL